jgi:hypothetical protein
LDRRDTSNKSVHKGVAQEAAPAPSGTLPSLKGQSLEVTRSLSPFGKEARWLPGMTDSGASCPGSILDTQTKEPQVVLMAEKHKVIFLLDSRSLFSVIPFSPGPRSNNKVSIRGISGQPLGQYFTQPLACSWGDLHFCHSFMLVPETPIHLWRRDLLSKLKVQILLPA